MQSQGSTSTQPSFDSMSSSDSLLFSDSEQAEDDTDVFLTDSASSVIMGGAGEVVTKRDVRSESPRPRWTCDEEEEESYRSDSGGKAAHLGLAENDRMRQTSKSKGDLLFAQKVRVCIDLHQRPNLRGKKDIDEMRDDIAVCWEESSADFFRE